MSGFYLANKPIGRPRDEWKINIRMNHKELVITFINWMALSQDKDHYRLLI